jgi:uncharacterized protein (DUF1778 family)
VVTTPRKDTRRESRLSQRDDDFLVEAAGLAGVSVSEFIASRALADAEQIVDAHHVIQLDADNYRRFPALPRSKATRAGECSSGWTTRPARSRTPTGTRSPERQRPALSSNRGDDGESACKRDRAEHGFATWGFMPRWPLSRANPVS